MHPGCSEGYLQQYANYANVAPVRWDLKRLFVLPLLRGEMGVGRVVGMGGVGRGLGGSVVGWVRGNRRVEKTGVTGEGEPVTMTCVSSSVPVRERCWISSHPLVSTRSVQKTRAEMGDDGACMFFLKVCF